MNKIKFNNTEFVIESYSKTTTLNDGVINSVAYCTINATEVDGVNALMGTPITSLQIYHDDELIYNLQNIHAQVNNINEYLSESRMTININLIFDNE